MRQPVDGNYYVTVGFNGQASYGPHEGVDINLAGDDCGTLLKLIADGEIVHSSFENANYGALTVVKIVGPWGERYIRYCHQRDRILTAGSHKEGVTIGTLGSSGNSTGCHLHFDMLRSKPSNWRFYSKDVTTYFEDPLKFIEKWKDVIINPPMTDDERRALDVLKNFFKTSTDKNGKPFGNLEGYANTLAQDAYRAWKNPPAPVNPAPVFNTQKGKLFFELAKLEG